MGGIGSGRRLYDKRHDSKSTTDESLPLDVRKLHRHGCLRHGTYSSWRWWSGPDTPEARACGASIGCLVRAAGGAAAGGEADSDLTATLLYAHRGEPVRWSVKVLWTPCNYGGRRPWWQCPSCARRVAVLYAAGRYFACRHCYGLCHASQKENAGDRALRAAWKIRRRLGQEEGGHMEPPPDKPKGMHWETYSRLVTRCLGYEHDSWGAAGKWLERQKSFMERKQGKLHKGEQEHDD
jgi:hypothetical protein